jgi:hypothetical protein
MVAMDVAEIPILSEVTGDLDLFLMCACRYPRFVYG